MKLTHFISASAAFALAATATSHATFTTFEATAGAPAGLVATRDAFRLAIGGGAVAGANGNFGGLRREINWDGVPAAFSDPSLLPANFFNVNSPRGVVFSTPGTGFLVSANAPGSTLFGFPNEFQTFSSEKLFTAVSSNITDVAFFVPGTNEPATTSAFGVIFTDVEVAGATKLEFFDLGNSLIYSHDALVAGNQGLTFLGAIANSGERIGRVRITAGANTILSNGVLGSLNPDVVAMDDFLYATPIAVPEPGTALFGLALVGIAATRRRR